MRGKVSHLSIGAHLKGITPAYAGKSSGPMQKFGMSGDHPRVCGEKPLQSSVNCTMEGSPPRMRGKEPAPTEWMCAVGITPAYAGKRRPVPSPRSTRQDHPRVCGEKPLQSSVNCTMEGSPPRMRGKAVAIFRQLHHGRITPAYAGKRTSTHGMDVRSGDHPRVCGEKEAGALSEVYETGSPPRVRGKAPKGVRP